MSVISKDLAGQIAFKVTEKSNQQVKQHHLEFREIVTKCFEDATPQAVKDLFKKHPDWIQTKTSVRLEGHGYRWEYVTTTRSVISHEEDQNLFKLNPKCVDKVTKAYRIWEKSKKAYEALKDETKQALLNLKTFNNIRKELPEAGKFLPPPMSNALVVSFDSLRSKIKQQEKIKVPVLEKVNS